jgi:hypothetical protein
MSGRPAKTRGRIGKAENLFLDPHPHTYGIFQMPNKDEILISVYGRNAPDAAKFGIGATTLGEIERATEARRELSDAQSTAKSGPVRRD